MNMTNFGPIHILATWGNSALFRITVLKTAVRKRKRKYIIKTNILDFLHNFFDSVLFKFFNSIYKIS